MKRMEFFLEMGKGLLHTVKEVSLPFFSDDLAKLDSFADKVTGIQWQEIGSKESFKEEGIQDLFVAGQPYVLVNQSELFAYRKLCPSCNLVVQWINYNNCFTCLNCSKSMNVLNGSGELTLQRLPLKEEEGKIFLGIKQD